MHTIPKYKLNNMTESKILNEAYREYMTKKHPNIPAHAIPAKATVTASKNLERIIKSKIINYLTWVGQLGVIVDSSAHYNKQQGRYTKSETTPGTSDIIACIDGIFWAIEVKRIYDKGRDRQSDKQKEFEAQTNLAGGRYVIVNDFLDFYNKVIAK